MAPQVAPAQLPAQLTQGLTACSEGIKLALQPGAECRMMAALEIGLEPAGALAQPTTLTAEAAQQ